jgi:hypothetical protein
MQYINQVLSHYEFVTIMALKFLFISILQLKAIAYFLYIHCNYDIFLSDLWEYGIKNYDFIRN